MVSFVFRVGVGTKRSGGRKAYFLFFLMLFPAIWNIYRASGGDASWSGTANDLSDASMYDAFFSPKPKNQTTTPLYHIETTTLQIRVPAPNEENQAFLSSSSSSTSHKGSTSNNDTAQDRQVYEALHISRDRLKSRVPEWVMDFFDWQTQQLQGLNSSNWKDHRFLIMRCTWMDRTCGGLTDRLRPIPLMMRIARESKRIFLIRWQVPFPLEEFLVPTPHVNWSCPEYILNFLNQSQSKLNAEKDLYLYRRKRTSSQLLEHCKTSITTIVEDKMQIHDGGSGFYKKIFPNATENYWDMTHGIFRGLFQPSPPVEAIVRQQLDEFRLVPGNYTVAHSRNYYKIKMEKVSQREVYMRSIDHVNCASTLRPGSPIYFAADSTYALQVVKEYAKSNSLTNVHTSLDRTITQSVNATTSREPLHLDFAARGNQTWPPSAFYDAFVDILMLGNARWVTFGIGGYGAYARMLSFDPSCFMRSNKHCTKFEKGSKQ